MAHIRTKKEIISTFVLDFKNKSVAIPVRANDIPEMIKLGTDVFSVFVYLCMQRHRNNFDASTRSVAHYLDMSVSKVEKIFSKLKKHGWLYIEKHTATTAITYKIWLGRECTFRAKQRNTHVTSEDLL